MPIKTGRILAGAAAALMLISTAAFAEQAEGLIRKVDKEAMTLTLDNGKSYKLNAEMDVDSLEAGMDVVIAYDVTNGENVITDMQVTE
ncbi:DUF1344 domain-containing protein [Aquamicrobium defluvii]|jgi:Cu/Ag efflux protein CusF|uniref:Uncharacterized protein DUF1344 n=1 Tax=Aquamicrobium defluvii TaxID=69279 RepID=A0A011VP83_9HYPH|nr:DUF1344 domain-containing protein [Aquamicrobium defluvii]EXL10185.1 hypothetical protein BG36_08520 [Aquamicrobium defluvii]EZQ16961.1 hypothetical protein CF98_38075 [Halopseudomonas bauzanensis]TDR36520.1 uncharacterized protein DUF1344 [Aquamicrobium defluvii]